jgi:hypothetical protein
MILDDNWTYSAMNTLRSSNRHHCRNVGHSRHNHGDYAQIKSHNADIRRKFLQVLKKKPVRALNKGKSKSHETPIINTNGKVQDEINTLTNNLKMLLQQTNEREKREMDIRWKLDLLSIHDKFSLNYHTFSRKLNDSITEGAWKEKEISSIRKKLNELCKCQGYSKIAHAFMALGKDSDPNKITEITASIVHTSSGEPVGMTQTNS